MQDEQWFRSVFHEPEFYGCEVGKCPACYSGQNPQRQRQDSAMELLEGGDLSLLNTVTVASDEELAQTTIPVFDQRGNPVREQVDEVDGKPIFEEKTRQLTDEEMTALKDQRNTSLDALESVTVQEVTEDPSPQE